MKVSLVTSTLGARNESLTVLLNSLVSGTHRNIELVVVDQSQKQDQLSALLSEPRCFPVLHVRSEPGLSRARNIGLAQITGDIVAFPDDDSWYPPALLSSVVERFRSYPSLGGLAGRPVDAEGNSSFPRWDLRPGSIDRFNAWRRCNSNALFLSRAAVDRVGGFDESLGVGSGTPWGAAEDIDYPLRVLAAGFPLHYEPTLLVHHPRIRPEFDSAGTARAESYGRGMGRVLRKHGYPWWFVLYQGARPLGGALISAITGRLPKARYHCAVLRGRRQGWLAGD
jgi:glycosyltransferase involved in cell wall biosynthesis